MWSRAAGNRGTPEFALRRIAVKALHQQPSRQLSTLRAQPSRVTIQPALLRQFHQSRLWRAESDLKRDEASPVEAETSGETVTTSPSAVEEQMKSETQAQPASAHDAVAEATGSTGSGEDAAPSHSSKQSHSAHDAVSESTGTTLNAESNDNGPALNTSSYDANAMPTYTSEGSSESTPAPREPAPPQEQQSESMMDKAQDLASSTMSTASAAASSAARSARAAYDNTVQRSERPREPRRMDRNDRAGPDMGSSRPQGCSRTDAPPSRILYIGNLFFEVTAPQLEAEFARFGQVANSRVVTDARGLSKGFAYVEFTEQSGADDAVKELDQKVFQGRRMAVQYHVRREPREGGFGDRQGGERSQFGDRRAPRQMNEPSKTLFIGNMSYQMSDRDLNDLFREIRNVLDVRVAIDRRSGQPRGFAHADFVDVSSAERAKEVLEKKVIYGRQLKIDFSAGSRSDGGDRAGGDRGADRGAEQDSF
ncbi:hypothetical protein LTR10_005055 [Elasticomyces elasticus]|nr:hypothetical protein LTR10_005055 [Elasticomyces elasticus]KAK4975796.1 hypothetical protein LTR42_003417 [Elasticomyces elasticus]